MAAGRNGVLLRRESYKYGSINEFDYYGNGSSVVEVGGSRNHPATCKNRSRSSSIVVDDSGSGSNGSYGGKEDREQGEFPVHASVFQAGQGEIFQDGDEASAPTQKRRKFSPIVWDLGEKEVRISSKNRIMQVAALSPTCPPLPSSPGDDGVLHGGVLRAKSSPDSSNVLPQEHSGNDNQDVVDEENNVKGWNITMSRWASDGHSPMDTSDNEYIHGKVCSSPEIGEFQRESLEGRTARSSGSSGGDHHYLSRSTDETDSEKELLIDSMDDVEEQSEAAFVSHSSSDSDENGGLTQVQRNINMLQSCRSVFEFEMIKKINEGTYGVVYKARDKKTGELVALKKVKMNLDREGFPLTSLREMNILLSCSHPSIVDVKEVVVDDFDGTFMVMEYMEYDLKGLMETKKQPFSIGEIKFLMLQLLEGVKYLHDNWVLHRDLKTSNILLNKEGQLKICDFGMSRQYGSPLKPYTPVVVTLWYRAPEVLLGTKEYTTAIDMWSVGCIMAELLAKEPLFRGKTEVEQLDKIFRTLGTPDEKIWPGLSKLSGSKANFVKQPYNMLRKKFPATSFTGSPVLSELGFDLLTKLLTYDPEKRITAEDALLHDWFHEAPLPRSDFKPIFPSWRC